MEHKLTGLLIIVQLCVLHFFPLIFGQNSFWVYGLELGEKKKVFWEATMDYTASVSAQAKRAVIHMLKFENIILHYVNLFPFHSQELLLFF